MRAIGITQFGDTPQLMKLPVPEPGAGEVQIAVEAASVNPLDSGIAAGNLAAMGEYRFPLTLGVDGAGRVTAVGEGVTGFRAGDRVFGQLWNRPLQHGTFAEVCVTREAPAFGALATVPDGMPSDVAAALPTAGMTAVGAVEWLDVPAGGSLLVVGATGGVGTFAVQVAASRGLHVTATASAGVAEQTRALGADVVLAREHLGEELPGLTAGAFDAVLDLVGDRALTTRLAGVVRDGGALLSIAFGIDDQLLTDERIRTSNYRLDRKPDRLAAIAELVTRGTIRPVIGASIPLEQTPHALAGGVAVPGLRGKTVLHIG
ncbi:NADP-dependent oxidoreductase [Streptomyces sp. NPDC004031]